MTFRKLAANSDGKLIRAYLTEHTPEPEPGADLEPGARPDANGRLTAYYTGRDSRAAWRTDMAPEAADALGIDPTRAPTDAELDRLFEARRADTGEKWPTTRPREISAYDLTLAPHKSVSLAAEFAASPAEAAAIWAAIDGASDDTMRFVAQEIGWARKGAGGKDGVDPGEVGWVSFRHHTARPTLQVKDGVTGVTYLAEVPMSGDPHAHIHHAMFNMVATENGRVGSLDTRRLQERVHEFGAFFQGRLAARLRGLGMRTAYDAKEEAFVLPAIPQAAVDLFSKGRRQTERNAKAYAKRQGLDWEALPAERKFGILSAAAVAERRVLEGLLGEGVVGHGGAGEAGDLGAVQGLRGGEDVLVGLRRGQPRGVEEVLAVDQQLRPPVAGDRQLGVSVPGQGQGLLGEGVLPQSVHDGGGRVGEERVGDDLLEVPLRRCISS